MDLSKNILNLDISIWKSSKMERREYKADLVEKSYHLSPQPIRPSQVGLSPVMARVAVLGSIDVSLVEK